MNPYDSIDINKLLNCFPQEEIDRQNLLIEEENGRVYKDFIDNLKIGKCFLCGEKIDSFDESRPCFHWFTYPNGIKKKHFNKYLEKPIGFFHLDSYFRWLANTDRFIGNINDLKEATSSMSFLETTCKYKNIEWAFSIGHTDKEGHPNSLVGSDPHFHIQMKVDDRIFLRFNDFHIPFSDMDLFQITLIEQAGDQLILDDEYNCGMRILEDENNLGLIDEALTIDYKKQDGPIRRQTLIIAPEGQTISGDLVLQAFEESKKTKIPMGRILQTLIPEARTKTVLSPNNGIEMTKRSGKK